MFIFINKERYIMEIIKLPEFDENGQIGYINLNINYIKYWSVTKIKDSLNIKIVLTDNMSFNMFYDYCDKSGTYLSNEYFFNLSSGTVKCQVLPTLTQLSP